MYTWTRMDQEYYEPETSLTGRLLDYLARIANRLKRALIPKRSVTISPRGLWVLILLIIGNVVVLSLLGVALYRTSRALSVRPPQVTVVATPTLGPPTIPPASPTPFGSGGAVAFTMRHDGNSDIYAINQATREVVRLTSDPTEDRDPAWSPDGQMLAFTSRRGSNWDVYLLDLEGGSLIRLTRDPGFDGNPTWSPDGEHIAFESYRNDNLDIYVMDADGRNAKRLTTDPAPDYSPAWAPDGSSLAFISLRDGNHDIYLHMMGEYEGTVLNITNSPNAEEADPAWSPDGTRLAYTIGRGGYAAVQISMLEWRAEEDGPVPILSSTDLFGSSGASPTWSPDGQGVVTVYQRSDRSYLIASSIYGWAVSQEVYSTEAMLDDPVWMATPLSARAIARARAAEPESELPLYNEFVQPSAPSEPPYSLVDVEINEDDVLAQLNDKVDDSFKALRLRLLSEAGWDFLASLGSSWRPMDHTPRPGQSRMSWHVCGRAFDVNQSYYDEEESLIYLVREDIGNETYWRVFIRASQQDGSMGEPLRVIPWDLKARLDEEEEADEGDTAIQGGRYLDKVPTGYYVDFTTLASDYGWERVPALYRWRHYWPDIEWWHFQKTDGLSWWECMLELYEIEEIEDSFGPIPEEEGTEENLEQ